MFKKALIGVASTAAFLGMAVPALAFGGFVWPMPSNDVEVSNVGTMVLTDVYTKADSGDNEIGGFWVKGGEIKTGAALSVADVQVGVNQTQVNTCGACLSGDVTVKNMFTGVTTDVTTKADTGDNEIHGVIVGGFFSSPKITTGSATSSSIVVATVNTTLVGL